MSITDQRGKEVSPYLVSDLNTGDDPTNPAFSNAILHYNATQPFTDIFRTALITALTQAGYQVTALANQTIDVKIQKTTSVVNQGMWNDTLAITIQATISIKRQRHTARKKTLVVTTQAARSALSTDASPIIFQATNTALNKLCILLLSDPRFQAALK